MTIERLPTPHQRPGRGGGGPRAVVIHTTDGTWDGTAAWFADPASGVSAHWLVGLDGRVAQLVDEADTAFHAGLVVRPSVPLTHGPDPNAWTIGVELVDDGRPRERRSAAQRRTAAELLRGICSRHGIPCDRAHVLAHRELRADKSCPGGVDVGELVAVAREPRIAVLLAVRDGASEMPSWLEAVRPLADLVIALDDGSTDATAAVLEADPLVAPLLRGPRRPTAAGWDDGANRARLLDAATRRLVDWVVFLDADERLPAADAADLRSFLRGPDALPGCAYGLLHHRVWGDGHDPRAETVFRVFAPRAGDRLPAERLHFVPVPARIPDGARIATTIRLLHHSAPGEAAIEARLARYEQADPERRWTTGHGGLDSAPDEVVPGLPQRSPGSSVLGAPVASPSARATPGPSLVVLLPVRDGAADLPGWLDAVRPLADAVIALDDGSSDDSAAVLEADPLVARVLRSPPRPSAAGWDDGANRQRLLDAAADLRPGWILFLDADERLPARDAHALRAFLEGGEADPRDVYLLRVFRMIGDLRHYDAADLWVARLFAWRPGLQLPRGRLHDVPAPRVPAAHRVRTTLRIQHLASLTSERRAARHAKYRDADPAGAHHPGYDALLRAPGPLRRFAPRPEGLPVRATTGDPGGGVLDVHGLDLEAPALTAIVIARDDQDRIERAVAAVVAQELPAPFEVIVVVSGADATARIVRERFPQVRLVELEGVALPGRARNAGLALARGDYVSFPGSHVELPPGSLAARLSAHEDGHAMVTGSLRNGTDTPAGWASFILDHAWSLPGRPSGQLDGPPAHCSYTRDALLLAGGFPEDLRAGEDTVVNRELWRRGLRAWRASDVELTHRSPCTTPARLVRHHWVRGRGLGRIIASDLREGAPVRRALAVAGPRYVPSRLRRTRRAVERWGEPALRARLRRVRPLVLAGAVAAWLGAWSVLAGPRHGALAALVAGRSERRGWRRGAVSRR